MSIREAARRRSIARVDLFARVGVCTTATRSAAGWLGSSALPTAAHACGCHMLLGAFMPGRDTTIQPCAIDAAPPMVWHDEQRRADPDTARAA